MITYIYTTERHMTTDITILLDKSASMQILTRETIDGYNALLNEQAEQPGEANLTLVQFETGTRITVDALPIRMVPRLTGRTYTADGFGTALYDSLCDAIDATGKRLRDIPEHRRPGKVLFVIITDGLENASRRFSAADVKKRIDHQRDKYAWNFVFTGANQDAILEAREIGIAPQYAANYDATRIGTQCLYSTISSKMSLLRSAKTQEAGTVAMSFNAQDRQTLTPEAV